MQVHFMILCLAKTYDWVDVARIIMYVSHTQVGQLRANGTRFFTIGIGLNTEAARDQVSKIVHKTVLSDHK